MAPTIPRTHKALHVTALRAPLELAEVPTIPPKAGELLVRVQYTAATPLHLHQADGGLMMKDFPVILGSTVAGIVAAIGEDDDGHFQVGDRVFGFCPPLWGAQGRAFQEYVTCEQWCFGKIPDNITTEEAVTLPENFVTVFNTMANDLNLPTPWPVNAPSSTTPEPPVHANSPILIWGAASSAGQYFLQVLRYYGYNHLIATASTRHHVHLKDLGASVVFDYNSPTVIQDLTAAAQDIPRPNDQTPSYPIIIDCIGSLEGSLNPIAQLATGGSVVASLLPVIITHSSSTNDAPENNKKKAEYSMDVQNAVRWREDGVVAKGVRTHFYADNNEFLKNKLQREIMPGMVGQGIVKANRYRVVEGATVVERGNRALEELRKGVSGEKLIWRVSEE